MKKLFLLLTSGVIAMTANGQQAARSVVFMSGSQPQQIGAVKHLNTANIKGERKTSGTAATTGWFDYVDTVLAPNIVSNSGSGDGVGLNTMYMWNDTTAVFGYYNGTTNGAIGYGVPSYGYSYNTTVGLTFDGFAPDWKTGGSSVSRPLLTDTSAYVIDSIAVVAVYGRPNGASFTDHINFSLVYGDGTGTSNMPIFYFNNSSLLSAYGLSSPDTALWFPDVYWDTTSNSATANPTTSGAPAAYTFSESLGATDTSMTNFSTYAYQLPTPFSVPAGNFAALCLNFVSGDATYAAGDSITSGDGHTFYHGSFQPAVAFNDLTSSNTVEYPPYVGPEPASGPIGTGDYTSGYFKTEGSTDGNGWSPFYVPNWAYNSAAGGAYYLQFPYIMFHVVCATCNTISHVATPVVNKVINKVGAYPNPASDVVNVAFSLATTSDVTVSLTNMVGQVVATQKVNAASNGSVQFGTSALPSGLYFYTLTANSVVNTGRIIVQH